jgi:hypothetical protein
MGRRSRRLSLVSVSLGVLSLVLILSACGNDPSQPQATRAKAQLDAEVHHAQQMGIPTSMVQSIVTGERTAAQGAGSWGYSYRDAATRYSQLYTRLLQVEQQSKPVLLQQATRNLGLLSTLVDERKADGFIEVAAYEQRLSAAQQALQAAQAPNDIAQVATNASDQVLALEALVPTYQQLQAFHDAVDAVTRVGIDTAWATAAYQGDLAAFRADSSKASYDHLQANLRAQTVQLVADTAGSGPYVTQSLLTTMQNQIAQLHTYGEGADTFQQAHDADVRALATAKGPADFLTLLNALASQRQQMAIPLARGKARTDIQTLSALVQQTTAKNSLLDYEYADGNSGVGDVKYWFDRAPLQNEDNPTCGWDVACRYGEVDAEAVQMTTNLQAMLQNLNDKTSASQPHQTDLQLIQGYGFTTGKVTIVSLREQVARAYQDGKLVYWSYVATGRPELPTPPGILYTISKQRNIMFQPLGPPGPVNGYPTPINYAVNFTSPFWHQFVGYYLHDAWWRAQFGPGSNLPHYDPSAFNTGSHGCVNFPEANMPAYYNWVDVGTPVIIY